MAAALLLVGLSGHGVVASEARGGNPGGNPFEVRAAGNPFPAALAGRPDSLSSTQPLLPHQQVARRQAVQRRLAAQEAVGRFQLEEDLASRDALAARAAGVAPDPRVAALARARRLAGGAGRSAALRPGGPGATPLRAAQWDELPGWGSDQVIEAMPAILASCRAFAAMTPGRSLGGSGEVAALAGTPEAWRASCAGLSQAWASLPPLPAPPRRQDRAAQARLREAQAARNAHLRAALEAGFVPHLAGEGLLTAYYEPVLRGTLSPGGAFTTPLYARPPELVSQEQPGTLRPANGQLREGRLEPLPDRAAIQNGALDGRGLELAWVDDPVEAFFLHIQGSGRVVLPGGSVLRLGYAGQNGQPYRAVGRSLVERGEVPRERMSLRAIRGWMASAGPQRAAALMAENPSYVFFQRNEGLRDDQGPPGAMGIPLTPERSVAVDPAVVPLGAPVFVAETDGAPGLGGPGQGQPGGEHFHRLLAAQDTGGAIRGPGRGDLFRGWGAEAGERAGNVRETVRMWVLLPRPGAAMLAGR